MGTTTGTNLSPRGNSTQPKSSMTGKRKLTWKPSWDALDSDTLDNYVEQECSADKSLYEANLGYKEARDTLNQVRQRRGFWPVIAIPAPTAAQRRLLSGTMMSHSVAKEKTARAPPTRARAKEARVEKVAKTREAKQE